ncbi:glycosyltransferase family 1 protein [Pseudonocardia ailaonensis]|uniref:Glycosyltransferase family 1 protein n=1 Tax=Pseudonocardia ailaonensis TaxID=367279 RepID=A0ABN2N9X4_9PSEU
MRTEMLWDGPEGPDRIDALARALEALGHSVAVDGPTGDPGRETAELLTRRFRAHDTDLVHANAWTAAAAALGSAAEQGIPVVVSGLPDGLPRQLARFVAQRCARLIVPGEQNVAAGRALGAPRESIRVIPPGVDADGFAVDGPALQRADHPRLLSVGDIGAGSGTDDLIAALARVPRAELLVAGGPATDDPAVDPDADPDLARLRHLAAHAGVERRVRLLGRVPRAHLPALLRSADVVVHVPHRAGAGLEVLEAMACGRPVVASSVGLLPEHVVEFSTGLLVAPASPVDLARTVRMLLSEGPLMAAFGIAGRDRVQARFGWPVIAGAVERVHREVVPERQPERAPG